MKRKLPKIKPVAGVGMPATLFLDLFGQIVAAAFDDYPFLVGTATTGKTWRDVDVRLILSDEDFAALGLGDPKNPMLNAKWRSLCLAYSALGKELTGLPIDFQIQQRTIANEQFKGKREAIGILGSYPK